MSVANAHPRSRAASVVGILLIIGGSIACFWRAANIVVMIFIGGSLPGSLLIEYMITNTLDVLWCGLSAVVGWRILKRAEGASRLLWISTAMWAGGTVMYALQAASAGPGVSSILRMSPVGILLGVLALRLVFWLPSLTAHVLLRQLARRGRVG